MKRGNKTALHIFVKIITKMKKTVFLFICAVLLLNISFGQESDSDFTDSYLSSLFKTFYAVDSEIAFCMAPILEERLVSTLEDSASFNYPLEKLSEYVTIRTSEDNLVKTFSWDRISGGSWHDNASYVQFKTNTGKIKYQRLDSGDEPITGEPTDVIIYKIHTIEINNETYYLLLGYGTHGGGKHHMLARVYKILNENIVLCNFFSDEKKHLTIEANRTNSIDLNYNSESRELSYNYFNYDESVGFYDSEEIKTVLVLKNKRFVQQNN